METYNLIDEEAIMASTHHALGIDYAIQPVPEPPDPAVVPSSIWAQAVREVIDAHPEVVVDGDLRATAARVVAPALDAMAHTTFEIAPDAAATVVDAIIEVDSHPTPRLVDTVEGMSADDREALRTRAAAKFDPTAMVPDDAVSVIDMSAHAIPRALSGRAGETPEFGVSLVPWRSDGTGYGRPLYVVSDGVASITGLVLWTMHYMKAVDATDRARLFIERIEPATDDKGERAEWSWDGMTDEYFDREALRRALAWYGRGSLRFDTLVIAATMAAVEEVI